MPAYASSSSSSSSTSSSCVAPKLGAALGAWDAPWDASLLPAFLARERGGAPARQLAELFSRKRAALRARVQAAGINASGALLQRLQSRGVRLHELGLDLTSLSLDAYDADTDVSQALALLAMTSPLETHLLRCDVPQQRSRSCASNAAAGGSSRPASSVASARWPLSRPNMSLSSKAPHDGARLSTAEARMVRQLQRRGVLYVHDWGLDTIALARQAAAILANASLRARAGPSSASASRVALRNERGHPKASLELRGEPLSGRGPPLPAVESILHNESLARVITAYLGAGAARYDNGYHLIRYPPVFAREFPAGQWHHDRCGRRLKLFVFVEDVHEGNHPTQVAVGTHNLNYYSHGEPWQLLSRYTDAHVRSRYEVASMTGQAGGGFLFDTNALHQALLHPANDSRTVVIFEFHPHGKVGPLLPYNNPCPSSKRAERGVPRSDAIVHGRPGYPLYPQESPIEREGLGTRGSRTRGRAHLNF